MTPTAVFNNTTMETRNLIGYNYQPELGIKFKAVNPAQGTDLPGEFFAASIAEANAAMELAWKAFEVYRNIDRTKKSAFLRSIADNIIAIGDALIERASAES